MAPHARTRSRKRILPQAEGLGRSKQRYFTLFEGSPQKPGAFRYFVDADDNGYGIDPKGSIELNSISGVAADKESIIIGTVDSKRIFELIAETPREAQLWADELRRKLDKLGLAQGPPTGGKKK